MITALDHVVIATRDLSEAIANYEALLGCGVSWRASHDGAETAFFTLDNISIELMTPGGAGEGADRLRAALEHGGEGIKSLVFRVDDIATMHRRAQRVGLEPEEVGFRDSVDQRSGETRAWKHFRVATEKTHGVRVFFLERDRNLPASPHVGEGRAFGIDHVVVGTPDAERAAALYGARLGLDLTLDRTNPQWGSRLMFFRCGDMIVEVAHRLGSEVSSGPDRFGGCTWRVANADAAQARIAAAGFNVSEVRVGRKPGTRVFTVRDRTCGVPTLMLQPSPERE